MAGTCFVTRVTNVTRWFLSQVSPSSYWRTHLCELCFSSFFPSARSYSPGFESCERTQSEQSLCSHTWEFVEVTTIFMSSSIPLTAVHLTTPPPPLPPSSAAPRLPMSLTQAPGARPGSRALLRISLFGAPKRRPSKNERWAEHRSWMAAARWVYTTMNRTMVSSAGGEFDRRRGRGGTCGEDVYASFWAAI